MTRSRRPLPPATPPVTVTISGSLRYWVAEALLEQMRWVGVAERDPRRRPARAIPAHRQAIADELRDLYDEILP